MTRIPIKHANDPTWVVARIIVGLLLYFAVANMPFLHYNPFIQDNTLAISMLVPVLWGILYGNSVGLFVGLLGPALNSGYHIIASLGIIPDYSWFELYAIIPYAIVGYLAGRLQLRPIHALAISLLVGHVVIMIIYTATNLITIEETTSVTRLYTMMYEYLLGIALLSTLVSIYRLNQMEERKHMI